MNARHLIDPELAVVLDRLPPSSGARSTESLAMIRAGSAAMFAGVPTAGSQRLGRRTR